MKSCSLKFIILSIFTIFTFTVSFAQDPTNLPPEQPGILSLRAQLLNEQQKLIWANIRLGWARAWYSDSQSMMRRNSPYSGTHAYDVSYADSIHAREKLKGAQSNYYGILSRISSLKAQIAESVGQKNKCGISVIK